MEIRGFKKMHFQHLVYYMAPEKDLLNEITNNGYGFLSQSLEGMWPWQRQPLKVEEDTAVRGELSCVY